MSASYPLRNDDYATFHQKRSVLLASDGPRQVDGIVRGPIIAWFGRSARKRPLPDPLRIHAEQIRQPANG
jgi:hypothetical protein